MRLVFKKSFKERFREMLYAASKDGRPVEKAVITFAEARELVEIYNSSGLRMDNVGGYFERWLNAAEREATAGWPQPKVRFMGVDVEVEAKA